MENKEKQKKVSKVVINMTAQQKRYIKWCAIQNDVTMSDFLKRLVDQMMATDATYSKQEQVKQK